MGSGVDGLASGNLREPPRSVLLHRMKDAFAQERKSGLAIALPFDEFQLGHMAFHHPV
jgi:hypothetical protein